MTIRRTNGLFSTWRFRREITLGTVLSLAALLAMLGATWGILQKELALIRHELTGLADASDRINQQISRLGVQCHEHEYRLGILESRKVSSRSGPMPPETIETSNLHHRSEETSTCARPETQTEGITAPASL